jgi:hypothetical protein
LGTLDAVSVNGINGVTSFDSLSISNDADVNFRSDSTADLAVDTVLGILTVFPRANTKNIYQPAKAGNLNFAAIPGAHKRVGAVTALNDTLIDFNSSTITE